MTLREMAAEYRVSAAKIAMYLQDHRGDPAFSEFEEKHLKQVLRDLREEIQTMDGYYTSPRKPSWCNMVGMRARKFNP